MYFDEKVFLNKIDKNKNQITIDEILAICYSEDSLPQNRSDIYSLISVFKFKKIFIKKKNGLYCIDWGVLNGNEK